MSHLQKKAKTSTPNFFRYGITGITFAYNYRINEVKCNRILSPFLNNHQHLKSNKIKGYAAKITTFFGTFIKELTGDKLTKTELRNLCLAGAITPIYDRFCDDKTIAKEELNTLTFTPLKSKIDDPYLDLFSNLLLHLQKHIKNIDAFNYECKRVMNAQIDSQLQNGSIELDNIHKLTIEKGGASFLFWASTIDRSFNKIQKDLFHQLGAFVQIIDDIFDIAQDLEQGVETIASKLVLDISEIENNLNLYLKNNFDLVNELSISKLRKRKLIRLYYLLAIPAFIYLKRLKKESKKQDLLTNKSTLKAKFVWSGWTPKYFVSMCSYLIAK